jgi:hypothetical protein
VREGWNLDKKSLKSARVMEEKPKTIEMQIKNCKMKNEYLVSREGARARGREGEQKA